MSEYEFMNKIFLDKIKYGICNIVFPENLSCIACNIPISDSNYLSLCKKCYNKLFYLQEICTKCGRSGSGSSICLECEKEKYYFDKNKL